MITKIGIEQIVRQININLKNQKCPHIVTYVEAVDYDRSEGVHNFLAELSLDTRVLITGSTRKAGIEQHSHGAAQQKEEVFSEMRLKIIFAGLMTFVQSEVTKADIKLPEEKKVKPAVNEIWSVYDAQGREVQSSAVLVISTDKESDTILVETAYSTDKVRKLRKVNEFIKQGYQKTASVNPL